MRKKRGRKSSRPALKPKRSQAAMEYLMVAGIAFVIIVPMMYVLYQYTSDMGQDVSEAKIKKIGDDIVNSAEQIFYLGEPSRTTLRFDMPDGVHRIYVTGDRTLVFELGDQYSSREVAIFSNVDIVPYLMPQDFAKGKHNYKVEAERGHVSIYTGDKKTAMLKAYAYRIFHSFMDNAETVLSEKSLITGSGLDYTIKETDENDVAYLSASLDGSNVDVSADITFNELEGSAYFWVGSSSEKKLQIEVDKEAGFLLYGDSTEGGSLDLRKEYTLNITTLDTGDYQLKVSEGDNNDVSTTASGVSIGSEDKWFFGDDSVTSGQLSSKVSVSEKSGIGSITTVEDKSEEITNLINMSWTGFHEISLKGNSFFFNISAKDKNDEEIGIPVSFESYYPVSVGDRFSGEYEKGEECEFTFTKEGNGVKIEKDSCT